MTDIKNFCYGGLLGGTERAGRWGKWAFGYQGDAYNHAVEDRGQFSHFRIGGGLAIALMAAAFGGIGMFLPVYFGGLLAAAALGGISGFVGGGLEEMGNGRDARKDAEDARAKERDQSQLKQLSEQRHRINEKIVKVKDRMHQRNEKAAARHGGGFHNPAAKTGHVDRLMQERARNPHPQNKGK